MNHIKIINLMRVLLVFLVISCASINIFACSFSNDSVPNLSDLRYLSSMFFKLDNTHDSRTLSYEAYHFFVQDDKVRVQVFYGNYDVRIDTAFFLNSSQTMFIDQIFRDLSLGKIKRTEETIAGDSVYATICLDSTFFRRVYRGWFSIYNELIELN
jgi:hypothetical protein